MLCAYSIVAPIGAGQISRENHCCSFEGSGGSPPLAESHNFFQDRHLSSNVAYSSMPAMDDHQDWHLLASRRNETHTALKFKRKFKTCDKDDRDIEVSM